MSEIVLYDGAGTPSPRRVKLCLLEKGLPFKIKWLNLGLMDQKNPEFLKVSPTGLVPGARRQSALNPPSLTESWIQGAGT